MSTQAPMTVAEAAATFGVHRNTIYHWIKTGVLRHRCMAPLGRRKKVKMVERADAANIEVLERGRRVSRAKG